MKSFKTLAIALIFICSICIVGAGNVFADNYEDVYESEVDKNTELSVKDIEREDLKAFIEAAEKVSEIRAEYSEKILEKTESDEADEKYKDLRKEAVKTMVDAIEDTGLDEKTYRGIGYHLQEDKDLFSKVD
ncbi:MAG: DUF4168 domain-containing protein [Thermodesulfobacteriota bacterium]